MREIKFRFYSNHLHKFVVPQDDIFVGALKDPEMNPMQFTGLLDRHGVEIYEGDIVASRYEPKAQAEKRPYVVCWREFAFVAVRSDQWPDNNQGNFLKAENFEVIGNIYENGDLLK